VFLFGTVGKMPCSKLNGGTMRYFYPYGGRDSFFNPGGGTMCYFLSTAVEKMARFFIGTREALTDSRSV
jgi:hypothetical protein